MKILTLVSGFIEIRKETFYFFDSVTVKLIESRAKV